MPRVRRVTIPVTVGAKKFFAPGRIVRCRACGDEFLVKDREFRRGRGRCCSVACAMATRRRNQCGVHNSHAKLTWKKVAEIRADRAHGVPLWVLAADFGVTEGAIWAICAGRTWKSPKPARRRVTLVRKPAAPVVCAPCRAGDCLRCDGDCACTLCADLDRMVVPVGQYAKRPPRSVQTSARLGVIA